MRTIPSSALPEDDGDRRLVELGMTARALRECARIGYGFAAACTAHDPRSLPGTLAWGKGTGHLRDEMVLEGWKADSTQNLETVVHPTGSHAVALASGTSTTGMRDTIPPRTRTPKGPATSRVVERNAQLSFAGRHPAFGEELIAEGARETWLLLHHYDADAEEIRLELSLPSEMRGKQVTGWRERILLEPVPFSTDINFDDDEDDGDIDVDVTRRAD